MSTSILEKFHPAVRSWFVQSFGQPSPPQLLGWPSISAGNNTLIVAPTGSGKTLAAFLWCINNLVEENISLPILSNTESVKRPRTKSKTSKHAITGVRVLYISPLKALNNDIHRNLEIPLQGITRMLQQHGIEMEPIRSAVRTGDTTTAERTRMVKHPPDILITTPESFYLMLTSEKSRTMFHSVRYVIIDEIHAISSNKRGVHLSLSLERLEHLLDAAPKNFDQQERESAERQATLRQNSFTRIGLSATQKPLDEVAKFLGGMKLENETFLPRHVTIVDAGYKKDVDLQVICAPRDFTNLVRENVWHSIYPRLLKEISRHKSTLIFVNNRRLAERLSAKLNELLEGSSDSYSLYSVPFSSKKIDVKKTTVPFTVYAYHGSMSRTVRERLESDLKKGVLRALVTTSALELGIDIGDVDLVIQIQSPKGIARGLQRVGRSGHLVNAQSKGRIFVTHREDLLESACVAQGMKEQAIERTTIPKNCLDVLAQQIVAMVSVEDWNVNDLFDRIRRSYCYATLGENIFHSVLEMLAGRYSHEEFRELRARIVWNKLHNSLSTLRGSSLLAIMNAGTIPDKGYYGVYLEDGKTKIGEVDEEFIYESRTGDTFILGTSVWRMMEIDANKVIVQPAPGQPARMPFWRGEMIGRSYELGVTLGEFTESISEHGLDTSVLKKYPVDDHSIRNIIEYIQEQKESTHRVPSHTTIVVEGFRDEIGDPRIVVHSRFGKGVNALLGIVLHKELQHRLGIEIQLLYNDDGILFRCSDVERLPLDIFTRMDHATAQQIILEHLPSSPLFGAIFRQNAERALLLPKGKPGMRRPFFLQRLKAADLLQIVKKYNDFPIVIETMRECLTDILDLAHFKEVLTKIENGAIRIHTVQTETPSPFASGLLFDFTMVYMYEWDDPKEANKVQLSQINRELLSEVVAIDTVSTIVRTDAIAKVEEQLQYTSSTRKARSPSEVMEIFLRLGDLNEHGLSDRVGSGEFIDDVRSRGLIIPVLCGKNHFFIATEELPLYRSMVKIDESILLTIPEPFLSTDLGKEESMQYIIARMLRSRGPVTTDQIAVRYNLRPNETENILTEISKKENLVHGILTKEKNEKQWCYRPNLDRIHRASINILRKEIKPASMAQFTQLLQQWQHRTPNTLQQGEEGVRSLFEMMQGFAMPADLWEPEILKSRSDYYDGSTVRSLFSRGEIVCAGRNAGRTQMILRGNGNIFLNDNEKSMESLSSASIKLLQFIKEHGASFLSDIREGMDLSLTALNTSLSELFWNGFITNDSFDEAINVKRYRSAGTNSMLDEPHMPETRIEIVNPRRNPFRKTAMRGVRKALKNVPGWNGRWSLLHSRGLLGSKSNDEEKIRRQAEQLFLRYGVVAREIAKREENLLPWSLLAMEMQRMEMRGEVRRGYFIEGLSGMQFALPEAVAMLEEVKHNTVTETVPIVVCACDPSNPYGPGIAYSGLNADLFGVTRSGGNFIIFEAGSPILWTENFGTRMFTLAELETAVDVERITKGLMQFIAHIRIFYPHRHELIIEHCNNLRPSESGMADVLRSIGFYRDKVQTMRLDLI